MLNLPFYVYVLGSGWILAALGVAFCIVHLARHERELTEMRANKAKTLRFFQAQLDEPGLGRQSPFMAPGKK